MRILFAATLHSPHTARWIGQLYGTGWDIHVAGRDEKIHPLLNHVIIHRLPKERWPFARGRYRLKQISWLKPFVFPQVPRYLARLIGQLQPHCVHSLKMQNEAYDVLAARRLLGGRLPGKWVYSSWGSDIYMFQHKAEHIERIKEVLANIDYYIPDCERDIALARKYGFQGEVPGVFPVAGAYPIDQMLALREPDPTSSKKIIALKGYQSANAGRALMALEAVRLAADSIRDLQVVVHSAIGSWASHHFPEVKSMAEGIAASQGISIKFVPYSPIEDIWALFGRSRISIGISSSDGIPNTMLEAMVMGAFPIQSDTGAITEWIDDGVNGLIVPHDDPETIAQAIRRAATDDNLVDKASEFNAQITRERLHPSIIVPQVRSMYERICSLG